MTTTTITAGSILNAVNALNNPDRTTFSRAEVAWLIRLAYRTGLHHGRRHDLADWLEGWAEHHPDPPTRADRIAAETGPPRPGDYPGGNGGVDWDTGQPIKARP